MTGSPMGRRMAGLVLSGLLSGLALTGCTTSTDHHYVFPQHGGDLLAAEIDAARTVGLRFHPTRGSMDLGRSAGGLPPDGVVEDLDSILAASEAAITAHHDPGFDSMVRIGLAPCSPFSVTAELLSASAELARRHGVRLHTHLGETLDEEAYCREHFGATPASRWASAWTARPATSTAPCGRSCGMPCCSPGPAADRRR